MDGDIFNLFYSFNEKKYKSWSNEIGNRTIDIGLEFDQIIVKTEENLKAIDLITILLNN